MLIVPYCGTLTDVCITAQSGFKAPLVAPRHSTCIKVCCMGTASSEIPQGAIALRGLLCAHSPLKPGSKASSCSHADSNVSLIPFLPLPFCVVGHVGSSRGWRVLEQCTPGVLLCCASWWDRERIASVWHSKSNMQVSKNIKTNFPAIQSVLLKQLVCFFLIRGAKREGLWGWGFKTLAMFPLFVSTHHCCVLMALWGVFWHFHRFCTVSICT